MRNARLSNRWIYCSARAALLCAVLSALSLLTVCVSAQGEGKAAPSSSGSWLAAFYAGLIVLFPATLIGIDVVSTHRHTRRTQAALIEKAKSNAEDFKLVLSLMSKAPTGMSGLSRTTMSVTVILIIGVALVHILVFGSGDQQIVERTLTTLVGVVASMMGFYFGGRGAQQQTPANGTSSAPTTSTAQISSIQPPTSKANQPVAAMGKGFGTARGEVRVGTQSAAVVDWSDTVVIFTVPAVTAGTYDITILLPAGGAQLKSAAGALTVN